jgi:hypothetical protein
MVINGTAWLCFTSCFAFVETFMLKTKKLYEEPSSQRNVDQMAKVQNELSDVHRILTQNIHDIVDRGTKISSQSIPSLSLSFSDYIRSIGSTHSPNLLDVSQKTDELFTESLKYEKQAKHLNLMQLWRTYGMYARYKIKWLQFFIYY